MIFVNKSQHITMEVFTFLLMMAWPFTIYLFCLKCISFLKMKFKLNFNQGNIIKLTKLTVIHKKTKVV